MTPRRQHAENQKDRREQLASRFQALPPPIESNPYVLFDAIDPPERPEDSNTAKAEIASVSLPRGSGCFL
jgi:hypothetical protein